MKKAAQIKLKDGTTATKDIFYRRPEDLRPWPHNPRIHSERQLAKLRASIRKFGFTSPILIDENASILAGHGRVEAAKQLGLESIPTVIMDGFTEAEKRAYVLADNKIAQLSGWDEALLKGELAILMQDEFEIEAIGFSTAEVDLMFDDAPAIGGSDPDDLQGEDLSVPSVTLPGDLWQLGDHRLLCGSALEAEDYKALLQGEQAQLVITDPPYNVPIDGHVCGNGRVKHKEFVMAAGEMSPAEFTAFLTAAFSSLHAASEDGAITYVFMDWRHNREVQAAAEPLFGPLRQLCVWAKDNGGMGTFYRSQHELVFIYKKGNAPHINNFELGQHGRYRTNLWNYPGVNTFRGKGHALLALHPTVKPVSLIADALRDCSHRNGVVLDPFAGSGTILVAAHRTGRRARAMELDPAYVDLSIQRWQRITGKEASLVATGQTWEQVRQHRLDTSNAGDNHGL